MKIKFSVIGIPGVPPAREIIVQDETTAQELVETAIDKKRHARLSDHYSLLINGRNVLSLPDKEQTKLKDGDEVILTVQVTGG